MFCLIVSPKMIEERMNRLEKSHNRQYNFLMDGKVEMRKVLEYIGVKLNN